MTDFSIARRNMVECQIRPSDVTDIRLQDAMSEIPRELFLPKSMQDMAYLDVSIDVAAGRVLMEPRCLAKLLQAAEIEEGDVVLDIGCATGYSTAIIAQLASAVVGIESDEGLVELASKILLDLGVDNAAVVSGDLTAGCPGQGPFDVIFVNGGVEVLPHTLFDQLKDEGRLVTVMIEAGCGHGKIYRKCKTNQPSETGVHALDDRPLFDANLPVLQGFKKPEGFAF